MALIRALSQKMWVSRQDPPASTAGKAGTGRHLRTTAAMAACLEEFGLLRLY